MNTHVEETSEREGLCRIWKRALKDRAFLAEIILSVIVITAVVRLCSFALVRLELRPGAMLDDPVLRLVGPLKLTWFTFSILWASVVSAIIMLLRYPRTLVIGFQAMGLILLFRTVTIYLIPLRPLNTIIPLADPLIGILGPGKIIIKDLLFSGHTSIMFLLCLSARHPWLRVVYLLGTITVGSCVVLQHVHYSGDVFIAPFFAYTSWRIVNLMHERFGGVSVSEAA